MTPHRVTGWRRFRERDGTVQPTGWIGPALRRAESRSCCTSSRPLWARCQQKAAVKASNVSSTEPRHARAPSTLMSRTQAAASAQKVPVPPRSHLTDARLLTLFDTPVAKISTDFCLLQSKRAHAAPAGTLRTAAQLHGHTQQRKRAAPVVAGQLRLSAGFLQVLCAHVWIATNKSQC